MRVIIAGAGRAVLGRGRPARALGESPQLGVGMGGTREKQGVTEGGDVPPLPLLTQTTPISPIWKI